MREGVGQRQRPADRPRHHGREEEVGRPGQDVEGRRLENEERLDPRTGTVLHADDAGVLGQSGDEAEGQGDAAEAGRVVDDDRDGRPIGHRGEVPQQNVVRHLPAEVRGRQEQAVVRPNLSGEGEEALGVPLRLVGGAGHHRLAGRPAGDHGPQHRLLLGLGEALVLTVRAKGQVAVYAGGRVGAHVELERVEVDLLVLPEGGADRSEHAGQRLHPVTSPAALIPPMPSLPA